MDTKAPGDDMWGVRGPGCGCPTLRVSGLLLVQVQELHFGKLGLWTFVYERFCAGPSSGELLGNTKSMTSAPVVEIFALWMLSPGQTARNVD